MGEKTPGHAASGVACPAGLADVDLFGPGAQEHWYQAYPILHREAPVHVLRGEGINGNDAYVLTCFDDIERVVKDPQRFTPLLSVLVDELQATLDSGAQPAQDPSRFDIALSSVRTLRPTLALWRAHRQELTDPWVGPGAKRHRAMITSVADELIDRWIAGDTTVPPTHTTTGNRAAANIHNAANPGADSGPACSLPGPARKGSVEFIAAFARPLPQRVMANVLGFPPEDVPQLARWGAAQVMQYVVGSGPLNVLSAEQAAVQAQQLEGFAEYLQDQVASKRANPADDMISALTRVKYQALGRKLTDDEVYGIIYFMVLGGLETTQYALEAQAQLLCDDPALFAALRRTPGKIRAFTEEALRLRAPTQGLSTRLTTRDELFQDVPVPAGSILHLRFAAGNVDPRQYDCPYTLDLNRKAVSKHLSFSQGPRTCPGAGISRLEQVIAWQRLCERFATLSYAPGNTLTHQPGVMLGTLQLQLEYTTAQRAGHIGSGNGGNA
ncbi:MAG: cytochrome P450 [Gammaproteobacteria bacterium]|nr:cytochrome P450 [Gammaproteobacteria bacterium]